MSVQYQLDPDVPDTVRVTDDASGTSRLVYDPNQAAQLRSQQAPSVPVAMPAASAGIPAAAPPAAPAGPMNLTGVDPAVADAVGGDGAVQGPPLPISASGGPPVLPPATGQVASTAPYAPIRYTGNAPPPQPAPDGTKLLKATIKPGVAATPYNQEAEDKRANKTIDRNLEFQRQSDAITGILNQQDIELGKQQAEDRAAQQQEEAKASRYEAELTAANKELDPGRLVKQEGIGGAILGLVGLAVAGFSKAPGLAMSRMNASLDARIARDINIQKEQKDSTLNLLTRQLGNAQQAAAMYRAGVRKAAFDRLGVQLKSQGTYNQYSDLMQAGRDELDTLNDQARQLSYGKPGAAEYQYGIPKPVKGTGAAAQAAAIGALPPGAEQYQQTELAKLAAAQGQKPEKTQAAYEHWSELHSKTAQMDQAMDDAKAVLKPYQDSNDVAGKGALAGKIPWIATTDEGRRVRMTFANAEELLTKELHGVRVPPETLERVHRMAEGNGTYEDMKYGIDALSNIMSAQNRALDDAQPSFARIHGHVQGLTSASRAGAGSGKAAQDAMRGGSNAAPMGPPAPPVTQSDSYLESLSPEQRATEESYRINKGNTETAEQKFGRQSRYQSEFKL